MHDVNTQLFYLINGLAGHYATFDSVVVFLTSYFSYVICIFVAFYVLIWIPMRMPIGMDRLRALARGGEMAIAVFLTWFVVKVIKIIIAFPRPFETLMDINVLVTRSGGDSFPSGHAALTCAVATAVYFHYRRLGMLLFAFSFIIAMSRIYVGVHYPLDIGIGLLIGYGIPKMLHMIFSKKIEVA
jgi:undecaprenyl-diphosphatase